MSRTKHSGKRNRDLWQPGALSGVRHSSKNKTLARRIQAKRDNRASAKGHDAA